VQIVRATGKDDSENTSSDELETKKADNKRQALVSKPGTNKPSMSEVKEATQESSPEIAKRGVPHASTR